MATPTGKARCIICRKERSAVRCEGCSQMFCYNHLPIHHQELSKQLDEIEQNRDFLRQTLTQQTNHPQQHSLIKQIDQWEKDSIKKIQQTAEECRQLLPHHITKHITQIEGNLAKLTDQLKHIRQENDFNEIDLSHLKEKLTQLSEELHQQPNVSIQQNFTSFINKISVVVSSGKSVNYI
ncbi:unnamed protein product [Rotaria sordida]|uniref:B box-type domain-containing protein n=3 Tax=Rotaria sordida TaxID=392033 RepID=A0A819VHC3_9BILA|nr:unnamed protein product [Rotaria sordida]CAF1496606.1 unnamed protein product [Rotaria sordida]CAF4108761.1 unnamed protein product [Rotaria sordida]